MYARQRPCHVPRRRVELLDVVLLMLSARLADVEVARAVEGQAVGWLSPELVKNVAVPDELNSSMVLLP